MSCALTDSLVRAPHSAEQGLAKADTTRQGPAAMPGDSLTGADSLFRADSLAAETLPPAAEQPFREVEADAFFGTSTALAPQPRLTAGVHSPAMGEVILQGCVLLLTVLYIRFIIQNAVEVRFLFTQPFRDAVTGKQRLYDELGNLGYLRFLNAAGIIGLVFLGCTFAAYAAPQITLPLPEFAGPVLIALGGMVVGLALVLYQSAALGLVGLVTLTQPFVRQLLLLKRTYFSLTAFALVPLLLCTIFTPESGREIWERLIIAELCILAFLFLKESLILFISQKLSILHWFLYLCAVECLPVSFIVLIAAGK